MTDLLHWTVETSQGPVKFKMPLPVYQGRIIAHFRLSGAPLLAALTTEDKMIAASEAGLVLGALLGFAWADKPLPFPRPRRTADDLLEYGEQVLEELQGRGFTKADGDAMAEAAREALLRDNAEEVAERADFSEAQPEVGS